MSLTNNMLNTFHIRAFVGHIVQTELSVQCVDVEHIKFSLIPVFKLRE